MSENLLIGLTSIIVLGIVAEWLAWRLRFPSILLLLIFGFLAGPVIGFLKPDIIFGDLVFPIVSLSVAVILYEGGLSLKISELSEIRRVVRRLVSLGAFTTWLIVAAAAFFFLGLNLSLSVLFGAITVVTGPTVIIPLLNHVRPVGQIGPILKWEAIVIDPLGAVLAVLVYEGILAGDIQYAAPVIVVGILKTILIGGSLGLLAALLLLLFLRKFWIPDYLQNPVSLMMVLGFSTASNWFQPESGLVSATVMGIILANQKITAVKHIIEFKENLRVLLISTLFIFLSARLELADFKGTGLGSLYFIGVLFLVARPLAVALSTVGSELSWRERAFLAWVAPRGIVAAAVSSIFALRLAQIGHPQAEQLVPYTFLVIVCTVAVYGLTISPVARFLKLSEPNPQGILIVGAHNWARSIAEALHAEGFKVLLVDTNRRNIYHARMTGLPTFQAHILSEHFLDEAELTGIGRMLALTSNDEINSFASTHMADIFGRAEVYQLLAEGEEEGKKEMVAHHLHGRHLFGSGITFENLDSLFSAGAKIRKSRLSEEFDYDAFLAHYGADAIPLFLIDKGGNLIVFTTDSQPAPKPGQTLISLVKSPDAR